MYLSFAKGRVDFVRFYIEAGFCRGLQLADGNLPAFTQRGDFGREKFCPGPGVDLPGILFIRCL